MNERVPLEARVGRDLVALLERNLRDCPPREDVNRVLTDGYAAALEIEADLIELDARRAAERDAQVAARLANEEERLRLRLMALRARLKEASRRFGRNPLGDAD